MSAAIGELSRSSHVVRRLDFPLQGQTGPGKTSAGDQAIGYIQWSHQPLNHNISVTAHRYIIAYRIQHR